MNIKSGIVESIYPPDKTNVLWVHKGILKHFKNGKWESISQGETGTTELEEKVDSLDKEMGEVKNDLIKFGSTLGVVELLIGNSEAIKASNLKILQSIQSTDHTFFTDIDYGYGTGLWLPATGGKATIFTSAGHMVCYTIGTDGSVTKVSESTIGEGGDATSFNLEMSRLGDASVDATTGYSKYEITLTSADISILDTGVDVINITDADGNPATYLYKATDEASGNEVWQSFIMDDDKGTFYFKALIQEGKLIIYSVPTVSAATATKAGVVKLISAPATLGTSAELALVIARLNGVITALISSGVFKGS